MTIYNKIMELKKEFADNKQAIKKVNTLSGDLAEVGTAIHLKHGLMPRAAMDVVWNTITRNASYEQFTSLISDHE